MSKPISDHAHVAKLIRAFLKAKGYKGSVRSESYSMGNSVSVEVNDLSPKQYADLQAEVAKYQYGHFDGMNDIYEYSNRRNDIPQVKHLLVQNRPSDAVKADIQAYAEKNYGPYKNAIGYEKGEIEWRLYSGAISAYWDDRAEKAPVVKVDAEYVPHAEGI